MQINKFDENKKKTLANRTIVSIVILCYYIFTLVFSFFSDSTILSLTQTVIIKSSDIRGIMAFIFIFAFYIPLPMAIYELNKMIFQNNKKTLATLLIVCSIYYLAPNITYVSLKNFANIIQLNVENKFYLRTELYLYLTFILGLSAILFIVFNLLLVITKKFTIKNGLTLNGIGFIVTFGFFALCYIGLSKSWTLLLFLFFVIWMSDIFCYLCGSLFGKRKLAPNISPNKTVEGAIYGFIVATGISLVYPAFLIIDDYHLMFDKLLWINIGYLDPVTNANVTLLKHVVPEYASWLMLLFLIMVLVLTCMCGDLLFSYVKRQYGIKDFSNVLKTHGGILDRLDSILFTGTCFTLFILTIQPLIYFWFGN